MIDCCLIRFDKRVIDYGLDTLMVFIDGENYIIDGNSVELSEEGNLIFYDYNHSSMMRYSGDKKNIYLLIPAGVFDVLDNLEKIGSIALDNNEAYFEVAFKVKGLIDKYKLRMI